MIDYYINILNQLFSSFGSDNCFPISVTLNVSFMLEKLFKKKQIKQYYRTVRYADLFF